MVQQIVEHIASVFKETGLFQKIYPLCQLVNLSGSTMPVHYEGGGNIQPVPYFSNNEGMGYFRKIGNVDVSTPTFVKTTSCKTGPNQYAYQLKFIGCVPKSKAECDNEYADDYFCNSLVSAINNITGLSKEIGAKSSNVVVTGFTTDAPEVYKVEFGGKTTEFPFTYSLFAINISAKIIASPECFEKLCYGQILQ
jgi:hypothetical protein